MSKSVDIDVTEALRAFRNGGLEIGDMLEMEKPIALTIVNKQREKVSVDTGATKTSISPHIQSASKDEVVDHVGPETGYSVYIETGVASKPNYPIQPFVRPSVYGNEKTIVRVATAGFEKKIREKLGG